MAEHTWVRNQLSRAISSSSTSRDAPFCTNAYEIQIKQQVSSKPSPCAAHLRQKSMQAPYNESEVSVTSALTVALWGERTRQTCSRRPRTSTILPGTHHSLRFCSRSSHCHPRSPSVRQPCASHAQAPYRGRTMVRSAAHRTVPSMRLQISSTRLRPDCLLQREAQALSSPAALLGGCRPADNPTTGGTHPATLWP